ncbi:MAG: DUF4350 domain-containing protein [Opitutaceae bacterium]|jgi:hypothetical protein
MHPLRILLLYPLCLGLAWASVPDVSAASVPSISANARNLAPNPDFNDGPWRSYTRQGTAQVVVSTVGGHQGSASLFLLGETDDAVFEAFSGSIPVVPGARLRFDFAYLLKEGTATVDVRWAGGGYVFSLRRVTDGWTSLGTELAKDEHARTFSGIRYAKGLGSPEGRTTVRDDILDIPADVDNVEIHVTMRGKGNLALDALRLVSETSGAAILPASAAPVVSVPVEPGANLISNAEFDGGPWSSYVRRGSGRVTTTAVGGYQGPSMMLIGESAEAVVEAWSADVAVSGSARLGFEFSYRLAYGSGTVDVRWQGGGYVMSLTKPASEWTTFSAALGKRDSGLSGILYTKGLGSPTGREPVKDNVLVIPPGVTQVSIHVTLRGQGLLAVDAFRLSLVGGPPSASATPVRRGSGSLGAMDQEELSRLLISDKPASSVLEEARVKEHPYTLNIHDVELPADCRRDVDSWPASASNLRVKDGQFVRTSDPDRPVFLVGLESTVVYPWLYRLLGADFVHFQDTCSAAFIRSRQSGDNVDVWWESYDWLDAQLRRALAGGLAAHVQPYEELQDVFSGEHMPFYKQFPELYVNRSHFINYRFEEPEGRRLRENMWRSVLGTTRKYPIFSYEMFNEVRYMDYSPANLAGFREAMSRKYETIINANRAWETSFSDFASMLPPVKSNCAGGNRIGLSPVGFSVPLWVDWQKYIERVFSAHLSDLRSFIHSVDRSPNINTTVQSTCDLNQGYSGGNGVYPPLKMLGEDIYGAEGGGGVYISQIGGDNLDEIHAMMLPGMTGRLTGFIAKGKPVMDIEVAIRGFGRSPTPSSRVVDLADAWEFRPDNAHEGEGAGFADPNHDDQTSAWRPIKVPGLWGQQGFADCSFGWYRARFSLPADRLLNAGGGRLPVYLNGSKLTDSATVYVNGVRVLRTTSWNERFGIDISAQLHADPKQTNTIVVSIENNYRDAGMYWGGIRDYLTFDDRAYADSVPLTAAQMGSFLWQKMVSGANGLVPSYAYTPEGDHLSMFNPEKVGAEALRAMPLVKHEIDNVSDIVLGENRRLEPVGLLYSFESGRARIPENHEQWVRAPAAKDLVSWYAALRFAGIPLNVVHNQGILDGRCDSQRVLLLRMSERLLDGTLEHLERFVRDGGTVIIDSGSAMINDDTHAPLDLRDFAGVVVGDPRLESTLVRAGRGLAAATRTVARLQDGQTGRRITLAGASAELSYEDGSPALTRHRLGRGSVYYVAAELPPIELQTLLATLVGEATADLPVRIAVASALGAANGRHVESDLFEIKDGSASLAYMHNWGDDADLIVRLPSITDGDWRVRRLSIKGVAEERVFTAAKLRAGLPVHAPCQDPVLLLIEPASRPGRELPSLPARRLDRIADLVPAATRKGAPRILFNASRAETMTPIRMLTANRLLRAAGYDYAVNLKDIGPKMHTYSGSMEVEDLAGYAVFATMGSATGSRRFSPAELQVLRDYVSAGGGLLIAANQQVGPHGWLDNASGKGSLAREFGLNTSGTNIIDPANGLDGVAMHPELEAVKGVSHPLLTGVSRIASIGSSVVDPGSDGFVLLRSSATATPVRAPAAVALEYGKGRVVLLGDAKWMQPETLDRDDNARFLLNIMDWLARREGASISLTDSEIKSLVDARLN